MFEKGDPRINREGRPPDTEEKKIEKKVLKELVKEYKDKLAESLPLISPVLIKKAQDGDLGSIKEINDRVMGKPESKTDITSKGEALVVQISKEIAEKNDINSGTENNSEGSA